MTREEASQKLQQELGWTRTQADLHVSGSACLGMLKLDEPKSAETKFQELIFGYLNIGDAKAIEGGMKRLGLKIVSTNSAAR